MLLVVIVLIAKSSNTKTSEIKQISTSTNQNNLVDNTVKSLGSKEEKQIQTQIEQAKKNIDKRSDLTPYEKQLEFLKVAPITKPDIEEPLWQGSKEKFKIFKIKITPEGYIPNAIIVEKGDSIQFNFFSEKDTDIESKDLKFFSPVPAHTITNVSFLPNSEGVSVFYCLNQCLGKERIFGHIMVRPQK